LTPGAPCHSLLRCFPLPAETDPGCGRRGGGDAARDPRVTWISSPRQRTCIPSPSAPRWRQGLLKRAADYRCEHRRRSAGRGIRHAVGYRCACSWQRRAHYRRPSTRRWVGRSALTIKPSMANLLLWLELTPALTWAMGHRQPRPPPRPASQRPPRRRRRRRPGALERRFDPRGRMGGGEGCFKSGGMESGEWGNFG